MELKRLNKRTNRKGKMEYKAYPEYKNSGVKWIGKIPKHWVFIKLKYILSALQSGKRENLEIKDNDAAFSIGGEHLNNDGTLKLNKVRLISKEFYNSMNSGRIQNGDILLVKDGATIGKTALISKKPYKNMAVNEHVFILRPNNKINSLLLYYLISGVDGFEQIKLTETGSAQGGISTGFADKVWFSIPDDKNEIDEISNYLDKKIAEIDTLIKKDKKLIELLQEKRTALINHVVTKGMNPNARMKDSGIEWIGEIPKDWEVRKLKFNAKINFNGNKRVSDPKTLVNFLPMEKVFENGDYDDESKQEYLIVSNGYTYFEDNDVLLAKITPCFENGKGTIVKNLKYGFGFGSTEFHVIRANDDYLPDFLFYLTKTHILRNMGEAFMEGAAGQKRISKEFIKEFKMSSPPIEEQINIVNYLNKQTSKIDKTIQKIQQKINLLEEYKKSLIHHVVTGKVDVRGVEI